jgi:hypothetical protein
MLSWLDYDAIAVTVLFIGISMVSFLALTI